MQTSIHPSLTVTAEVVSVSLPLQLMPLARPASAHGWVQPTHHLCSSPSVPASLSSLKQSLTLALSASVLFHHLGLSVAELHCDSDSVLGKLPDFALGSILAPDALTQTDSSWPALCSDVRHDRSLAHLDWDFPLMPAS